MNTTAGEASRREGVGYGTQPIGTKHCSLWAGQQGLGQGRLHTPWLWPSARCSQDSAGWRPGLQSKLLTQLLPRTLARCQLWDREAEAHTGTAWGGPCGLSRPKSCSFATRYLSLGCKFQGWSSEELPSLHGKGRGPLVFCFGFELCYGLVLVLVFAFGFELWTMVLQFSNKSEWCPMVTQSLLTLLRKKISSIHFRIT